MTGEDQGMSEGGSRASRMRELAGRLSLNVGISAFKVLGPRQYARMWVALLGAVPNIVGTRSLRGVDERVGRRSVDVRVMSTRLTIDCPANDSATKAFGDTSFTFGLVRELYIRNCYLRSARLTLRRNSFVIDGGANRGLFSLLAAKAGAQVISIEPSPAFGRLIHHNMAVNGLSNYVLEMGVLGGATVPLEGDSAPVVLSLPELIARHGFPRVDLLKLDIEGGEFPLFEEPGWMTSVRGLTMEVHPSAGDPAALVRALHAQRFVTELRDVSLRPTRSLARTSFVYAYRES